MDGISSGVKKIVKICFIPLVVIILLMFFIGIDNEINNKFVITLNNNELLSRVDTEYVEIIFKKIGGNTYNKKVDSGSEYFNKINSSNKYILDIKEYEIYGKYGHRVSYKGIDSGKGTSKFVTDDNKTMMVQKDNKIVYEGKFKNDVTSLIIENGRYFFHVYTSHKRSSSPFAYMDTSLHFNVLVGEIAE